MSNHQPLKAGERAFNVLLLLLSLGVFYEAYRIAGFDLPNSAGAFPLLLGAIMTGSMVAILWGQRHHPGPATRGALDEVRQFLHEHFPLPIVVFSAMAIAYLLLLRPLGFIAATALFLFVAQVYLRRGRFLAALIITAVATGVIYALFKLLFQVYLP
ncbi:MULTISPECIES: tripartite tricarboxylate transporter TctB family protein [unclassified Modicisalibacter]|uniref:tripartite tricarboxylate transporter TctB family protein n=1 Tax=unclassified Modicisalibacter TaxID=2679913 RepID=UPI001CCD3AF6|nr:MULTISPECIES: tripartite tricarboxylate transporter TctB family protein [unclassified Modicisalibacter]MBZ9557805.1 tripartite tricarboxylate transporter TctB family protein [Modicisalibacter sp. R2A 31.J]MBZ9573530.1 tripartite tricarboxylate transporter TctB family protein [Modicisalibacter sp. MOD 31.J]